MFSTNMDALFADDTDDEDSDRQGDNRNPPAIEVDNTGGDDEAKNNSVAFSEDLDLDLCDEMLLANTQSTTDNARVSTTEPKSNAPVAVMTPATRGSGAAVKTPLKSILKQRNRPVEYDASSRIIEDAYGDYGDDSSVSYSPLVEKFESQSYAHHAIINKNMGLEHLKTYDYET